MIRIFFPFLELYKATIALQYPGVQKLFVNKFAEIPFQWTKPGASLVLVLVLVHLGAGASKCLCKCWV